MLTLEGEKSEYVKKWEAMRVWPVASPGIESQPLRDDEGETGHVPNARLERGCEVWGGYGSWFHAIERFTLGTATSIPNSRNSSTSGLMRSLCCALLKPGSDILTVQDSPWDVLAGYRKE